MILLSETTGSISIQHCKIVSLVTFYQDCSNRHDSKKYVAARGSGLIFPMYLNRKLKKSSCQKPLDRFHYNLTEMFPC